MDLASRPHHFSRPLLAPQCRSDAEADTDAYVTGSYGCIGRPLALLNIRTLIAKLLLTYDFTFAPGETGRGIEEDSHEHFTLAPGNLHISFSKREVRERELNDGVSEDIQSG